MTVKQATLHDAAAIAVLFDAYRCYYEQAADLPAAEAFISKRLRNEESVIYVAMEGEQFIGFVQLYPFFTSIGMKRAWVLNDLYVLADHRNKGVGRALVTAAEQLAKATASGWVMLQTHHHNTNAQALYEKLGFQKDLDYCYYYLSV